MTTGQLTLIEIPVARGGGQGRRAAALQTLHAPNDSRGVENFAKKIPAGTPGNTGQFSNEAAWLAAIQQARVKVNDDKIFYRELAKTDLYFLAKFVLGYDKLDFALHHPLCLQVMSENCPRKLFLWPRGHFKTTIITIARIIQRIFQNPNIGIGLFSGTASLASKTLVEIKGHFVQNETLRYFFPEFCPPSADFGTLVEFTVPNRTIPQKEPTVTAVSTETKQAGFHYDEIFGDDLISEKNCTTREQVAGAIDWFQRSFALLREMAKGRYTISGTVYAYGDVHQHILDHDNRAQGGQFACYVRKAIENGKPLFPGRYSLRDLEALRVSWGAKVFNSQMLMEPTTENTRVTPEMFVYHDDDEATIRASQIFLLTDAAFSRRELADYCALVVCAATPDQNWDVLEYTRDHLNPREFINRIWHYWGKYQPLGGLQGVTIQQAVLDQVLAFFLNEDMNARNEYLPIRPIAIAGVDKIKRITRAVTRLQAGKLRWRRTHHELEDELLKFPSSPRDDLSDALSDMADVAPTYTASAPVVVAAPTVPSDWTLTTMLAGMRKERMGSGEPTSLDVMLGRVRRPLWN